jgi:hypothetical protein
MLLGAFYIGIGTALLLLCCATWRSSPVSAIPLVTHWQQAVLIGACEVTLIIIMLLLLFLLLLLLLLLLSPPLLVLLLLLLLPTQQGTFENLDESLAKETAEQAAARLKQESANTRSAVM